MDTTAETKRLMEQCHRLKDAGKTAAARRLFGTIERLSIRLAALEGKGGSP